MDHSLRDTVPKAQTLVEIWRIQYTRDHTYIYESGISVFQFEFYILKPSPVRKPQPFPIGLFN